MPLRHPPRVAVILIVFTTAACLMVRPLGGGATGGADAWHPASRRAATTTSTTSAEPGDASDESRRSRSLSRDPRASAIDSGPRGSEGEKGGEGAAGGALPTPSDTVLDRHAATAPRRRHALNRGRDAPAGVAGRRGRAPASGHIVLGRPRRGSDAAAAATDGKLDPLTLAALLERDSLLASLTPDDLVRLRGLRVACFGDSVLGDVFLQLALLLVRGDVKGGRPAPSENYQLYGAWAGAGFKMSPKDFHQPGGAIGIRFPDTGGDYEMMWFPSVHQYSITKLTPKLGYRALDAVVVGVGAWDMGAMYNGADRWRGALAHTLDTLVLETQLRKPFVVVSGLHRFWTDRCEVKDGPCVVCNPLPKEEAFREIVAGIVGCEGSEGDGGVERYTYYDTLDITSTPEARGDSTGAHYGVVTNIYKARRLGGVLAEAYASRAPPRCTGAQGGYDARLAEQLGSAFADTCRAAVGGGGDERMNLLCWRCREAAAHSKQLEPRCALLCAQKAR